MLDHAGFLRLSGTVEKMGLGPQRLLEVQQPGEYTSVS
jgi:hypothetical protein